MRPVSSSKQTRIILTVLPVIALITGFVCVCAGSVAISPADTLAVLYSALTRSPLPKNIPASTASILLSVRLPRVLCVALAGASLSICGAAMQGLLKNPLADGSTLGVSTGASLGAALSIAFGLRIPFLPFSAASGMAAVFAFLSLMIIMALAWRMDHTLSTNTIILIGIIYSMFISSILSLVVTFASSRLKQITFWTMGSLSGSSFRNAAVLAAALLLCGGILLSLADELNAFAVGENEARSIGVNVRRTRLTVLAAVSVLIGISVSIGGSIAFVGLVTPHIVRMITGPNHRKLLPACLFGGAVFLLLADLAARVLLKPLELPVGVVTSFAGAVVFVVIYYRTRKNF